MSKTIKPAIKGIDINTILSQADVEKTNEAKVLEIHFLIRIKSITGRKTKRNKAAETKILRKTKDKIESPRKTSNTILDVDIFLSSIINQK